MAQHRAHIHMPIARPAPRPGGGEEGRKSQRSWELLLARVATRDEYFTTDPATTKLTFSTKTHPG